MKARTAARFRSICIAIMMVAYVLMLLYMLLYPLYAYLKPTPILEG